MSDAEARRYGYSDQAWDQLAETDRTLLRQLQPAPRSGYKVNKMLSRLEDNLAEEAAMAERMGGTFDLNPDFQRGHVWDQAKQVAYVENFLRGYAPALFRFNCPSIQGVPVDTHGGDIHPYDMVCIDGLQRLTALRAFMAEELTILGGIKASDLKGTVLDPRRTTFSYEMEVFTFTHRHELLDYYVALNTGGVVHSNEEIERVKALRDAARPVSAGETADAAEPAPKKRRAKP